VEIANAWDADCSPLVGWLRGEPGLNLGDATAGAGYAHPLRPA
jgi:hypothetical protein